MRFVTGLALLLVTTAAAVSTAAVTAPRAHVPTLTTKSDHGTVALGLEGVRVDVLIRGHLARTTYELTYRNALDEDVDGDFTFPLPLDAEVSDLGLYFGKRLRHAVAVERVQARRAYDEVVHRRADPALAEWSSSTRAFRFRVYPIPAKGTKVVHIAYDQELTSAPYELDLRYDRNLTLDLAIDSDTPVASDGLALRGSGGTWSARGENVRVNGILRARRLDEETALMAWSAADQCWYASAPAYLRSSAPRVAPASHVTLLYDVSSSAAQRDEGKLRELLSALLARQSSDVAVTVIPFHIDVERAIQTSASGLERTLADLPSAGATDLAGLLERLPLLAAAGPPDSRLVLVTDGISTLGDSARLARAVAALAKLGRPLTVINASDSADDHFLAGVARATGGWHLDLTHTSAEDAAESAMRVPTRLSLLSAEPTVRDVVPTAMLITTDARITINARSRDRLTFFSIITGSVRHDMPVREVEAGDLVRRAWARARLRDLLAGGASDSAVLEHGLTFNQLTPRTSLLVLDSWRDYEHYGVPMPPDVREEREAELAVAASVSGEFVGPGSVAVVGTTTARPAVPAGAWVLKGKVVDREGSALPGVTVTMRTNDGQVVTVVSDAAGEFWITALRAPASFSITLELPGMLSITHEFPRGAQSGAIVEIRMEVGAVSESITVSAEAPMLDVQRTGVAANFVTKRPTESALADKLLGALAGDEAPELTEEESEASAEQRLARIAEVVARLRSLPSESDRIRYYVTARSVLGGDKLFQAESALALRADAPALALRALTDLAEVYPDDAPTLRIVGRVLDGWGRGDLARLLFERALELAPDETQTWRELMLLAAKDGRMDDLADLRRRFAAAERDDRMVQTEEAMERELGHVATGADPRIDAASELQVEALWDSNYTDVDLHVVEPSGEEVFYKHMHSAKDGHLHADVTTGFGPETYTLPILDRGRYQIVLTYYSDDETRVSRQTLAHVIVYVRGERHDSFVALVREEERQVVAEVEK